MIVPKSWGPCFGVLIACIICEGAGRSTVEVLSPNWSPNFLTLSPMPIPLDQRSTYTMACYCIEGLI